MEKKKSNNFTIGVILLVIGILFIPFFFQIIAFTNTAIITPKKYKKELDNAKEGDSWWVYGWIEEKKELNEAEQMAYGGKYNYTFKSEDTYFISSEEYTVGMDILVEVRYKKTQTWDYAPINTKKVHFFILRVPGLVIALIGVIPLYKGLKERKAEKERREREQAGMLTKNEMNSFLTGPVPPSEQQPPPYTISRMPPPGAPPFPQGASGTPPQQQPFPPSGVQAPSYPSQPQPDFYKQTPSPPTQQPPPSQIPPSPPSQVFPLSQSQPPKQPGETQASSDIHKGSLGVPQYVKCPTCGEKIQAPPIRPARVQCPKCGTKGTIN